MPLLWGTEFSGRMDAKMDRKSGVLTILNLHLETDNTEGFIFNLKESLDKFLRFNNGTSIKVAKITSNRIELPEDKIREYHFDAKRSLS